MAQKFITPITIKQLASTGSDALTVFVDGEVYGRVRIEAGGRISWSDGAGSYDTNIYRSGANTLSTDDVFKAISGVVTLAVNGVPTAALPDGAIAVDTLNNAFYFRSNGTWTQVTGGGGGGATVTVSDTPPASPTEGDLWFESDTAKTHVYYDSFWVEIGASGGVATLDNIGDVTAPTPTSGDFLKWNGTAWVNDSIDLGTDTTGNYVSGVSSGTGISVSHTPSEGSTATVSLDATLDNLSNVTVPSPTTNDVLQWNGTAWVNVAASTVGATTLDGLSDVVVTSPEEFQGLAYNGTNWVNGFQPVVSYVRNAEATTLTTGTVVYLFGATGDHATVKRADHNAESTSSKTVGVVGASITASNNGPVVTRGYVDGIDLSVGYTSGDVLWLGENGAFTKIKPTAPDHLVYVGVVVRATNNGIIYVAAQNGYELDELHNVSTPSPAAGDFLKYNGTLWVNDPINLGTDTTGDYMSGISVQNGLTVSHTPGEGSSATIGVDNALLSNFLLDGASGNSYGLIGTSAYLDVKNTNGYNKEIELDIAAVKTQLNTDGYITESSTSTLTNKTLTSPKINENVALTATATELNYVDGVTSAIQTQLDAKAPLASPTFTGTVTLPDNTVALGTKTTGNYVESLVAGTGVTLTNGTASEGGTPTIAIGQAVGTTSNVQFNDVTVDGNLTVNGTTTTLNTDTLAVEDNIIVLNSNITASPTLNAGIEVERGTSANVLVRWNETSDRWEFTNDGSVYTALGGGVAVSDTAPSSPVQGAVWFESDTLKTFVYYDSSWVEIGVTAGVAVLDDLTDVSASAPSSGDFLKYDGTEWVPDTIPTINALDDIGDVNAPSPATDDVLTWDGTEWIASAPAGGGGLTVSASAPASPAEGDMWFDSDTAKTYVYYDSYWVEVGNVGGTATVLVSSAAPASPTLGTLWFDSDTAQTFAYYDSQWIEVGASGMTAIVSDTAPTSPISGLIWFNSSTGQTFTYYDSFWIELGAQGVAAYVAETAPTSPVIGQIWFNSATGGSYIYFDSTWVEIGAQPLDTIVSTIDAKGDILVGIGDNSISKVSAGSDTFVLTANSATATGLQWVSRATVANDFEIASIMGVY